MNALKTKERRGKSKSVNHMTKDDVIYQGLGTLLSVPKWINCLMNFIVSS